MYVSPLLELKCCLAANHDFFLFSYRSYFLLSKILVVLRISHSHCYGDEKSSSNKDEKERRWRVQKMLQNEIFFIMNFYL